MDAPDLVTGSFIRRRVWVSDGASGSAAGATADQEAPVRAYQPGVQEAMSNSTSGGFLGAAAVGRGN